MGNETPTNDAPVTVEETLRWYAEMTEMTLGSSETGRRALEHDGGRRAYACLAALASAPAELTFLRQFYDDWRTGKSDSHLSDASEAFEDAGGVIAEPASAPAGDGVEEMADLMADEHLGSHYDDLDSIDRSAWHHFRAGALAALARLRACRGWGVPDGRSRGEDQRIIVARQGGRHLFDRADAGRLLRRKRYRSRVRADIPGQGFAPRPAIPAREGGGVNELETLDSQSPCCTVQPSKGDTGHATSYR